MRVELTIDPEGPFSLPAASRFMGRFKPLRGSSVADGAALRFAFVVDGYRSTAAVSLRQAERHGRVHVTASTEAAPEVIDRQVRRILSLDRSAAGYAAIGGRDPVIARLLVDKDWLRPVCFYSAYEAAAWAVLAGRRGMGQAETLRAGIMAALGDDVDGVRAFPTPARLLDAPAIPGVSDEPLRRLRGVAEAALAGQLDTERLAALPADDAMRAVRAIRGIGPFYASLIYVRACGAADYLAVGEPRLHRAVRDAYGLPATPDAPELERIARAWAPYRTWVNVLLRASA